MEVVYSGPHAAVEVPDAGIVAERGVKVDVPDDVGERLIQQDTWAKADAPARKGGK